MKFLFFCAVMAFSSPYFISNQTIDKEESEISFSINNLLVNTVDGSFKNFEGEVILDLEKPENSRFQIKIPVANIDAKNQDRDKHLQAEEYFNAEKFPFITFKSSFVNKTSDGISITGNLKIKGISKTFTIPFTYHKKVNGYMLKGNLQIDRFDFKVGSKGSFSMGRMVNLDIKCLIKNN